MSMGRRALAGVVALLITAALAPQANAAEDDRALRLIGFITGAKSNPETRWEAFDTANLNYFDIDNNGLPELVTQNDNNHVYVIDPRNGTILAEIATTHPGTEAWGARELQGVGIGDVDGDGNVDLVIANSAAYLSLYSFNPERSTRERFDFVKQWEVLADISEFDPDFYAKNPWANNTESYPGLDGNPFVGDVDGDGRQEIFVQTDGKPGQFSFSADGDLRWVKPWGDGNAGPVVADLDGDGKKEVVFATDGGSVTAYDAKTGNEKWRFDVTAHGTKPGSISVMPTVVDVDRDGKKEVFVAARQAVKPGGTSANASGNDTAWIQDQHAGFFSISHNGTLRWKASFKPWGNPHVYMRPAAVDLNGDGVLDLLWVDWNTIGRNPGNWELTGRPANLVAVNGKDGKALWHKDVEATWSNKDIAVADVDGDGKPEIIVEDQDTGNDGLSLFALSGMRKGHIRAPNGWLLSRGPVVADLYGDGGAYVTVPVYRNATGCTRASLDVGCREGAIAIYRSQGKLEDVRWTNNMLFNADLSDVYDPHDKLPQHLPTRPPPPKVTLTPPDPIDDGNGNIIEPGAGRAFLPAPGLAALLAVAGAVALAGTRRRRE